MNADDGFVRAHYREHVTVTYQASGEVWVPTDEPGENAVYTIRCAHAHGSPQAARECAEKIGLRLKRKANAARKAAVR